MHLFDWHLINVIHLFRSFLSRHFFSGRKAPIYYLIHIWYAKNLDDCVANCMIFAKPTHRWWMKLPEASAWDFVNVNINSNIVDGIAVQRSNETSRRFCREVSRDRCASFEFHFNSNNSITVRVRAPLSSKTHSIDTFRHNDFILEHCSTIRSNGTQRHGTAGRRFVYGKLNICIYVMFDSLTCIALVDCDWEIWHFVRKSIDKQTIDNDSMQQSQWPRRTKFI